MEVYIEYAFADNFVMDFIIFRLTAKIAGKSVKTSRILICSFLSAAAALVFPLFSINGVFTVIFKILFGLLAVTVIGNFKNFKDYIFTALIFFTVTFLTGGAVFGVFYILGVDYSSEYALGLAFIPAIATTEIVSAVYKKIKRIKFTENFTVKTEIILNGVSVKCLGFFDTGNALYDGLSPVILIDKRAAEPFVANINNLPEFNRITVNTASGSDRKLSVKNTQVVIYSGDKRNIFNNVTMAIADLSGNEFQVILHPDLMEVNNAQNEITENVS